MRVEDIIEEAAEEREKSSQGSMRHAPSKQDQKEQKSKVEVDPDQINSKTPEIVPYAPPGTTKIERINSQRLNVDLEPVKIFDGSQDSVSGVPDFVNADLTITEQNNSENGDVF